MTEDSIPNKRIFKDPVHDYGGYYNSVNLSWQSHRDRDSVCPIVEYDPWICSFIDT